MSAVSGLAITLKVQPYQERHQIVTALTPLWGKVTALARNSVQSRRFGGSLYPFTVAEWSLGKAQSQSDLIPLLAAEHKRSYQGLSASFDRLALASALSEWMLRIAQPQLPSQKLFQLHCNALGSVEILEPHHPVIGFLNVFLLKVTQWSGSQPRLLSCLICQKSLSEIHPQSEVMGHVEEGGWTCLDCSPLSRNLLFPAETVMDGILGLQQSITQAPAALRAKDSAHRSLFVFLEQFLAFHHPGFDKLPLKSLAFLNLQQQPLTKSSPPLPVDPWQ